MSRIKRPKNNNHAYKPHHRWTDEAISRLGQVPDITLSIELGVHLHTVRRRRISLAIPERPDETPQQFDLPNELIEQLGKKSDSDLSKEFAVPIILIAKKRGRLGIKRLSAEARITAEARALLGTMPDDVLAKRFDISPSLVTQIRRKAGIQNLKGPKVAKQPRIPKTWNEQEFALLGRVTDTHIAALKGIARSAVQAVRSRFGIPPHVLVAPSDESLALLGTMPDEAIANLHGGRTSNYSVERRKRGIKMFNPNH